MTCTFDRRPGLDVLGVEVCDEDCYCPRCLVGKIAARVAERVKEQAVVARWYDLSVVTYANDEPTRSQRRVLAYTAQDAHDQVRIAEPWIAVERVGPSK